MSLTLTPEDAVEVQESTSPQAPADQLPHGLKGVSKSLVDRVSTRAGGLLSTSADDLTGVLAFQIRAKEAQKIKAAMTRSSGQAERLLMMSRLPELARILRNVFVEAKKPAIVMEVACNRMVASYRSALSPGGWLCGSGLQLYRCSSSNCTGSGTWSLLEQDSQRTRRPCSHCSPTSGSDPSGWVNTQNPTGLQCEQGRLSLSIRGQKGQRLLVHCSGPGLCSGLWSEGVLPFLCWC